MSKVHSSSCWSKMMCVPCTNDKLLLMTAERDGLASKIQDVQQDCVEAGKEVTRLSNYETSYNNLQSVVTSQYRNIDALTGELTEARGHWRACEEGWNKVIKQAEDFQGERDDYKAHLEEEKGLTDTAIRAMEAAENTLEEYSDRIVELSDSYTDLRLALPAIIFGVVYYDLGEHGITWKVCAERWAKHWEPSLREEHGGDCTDECYSCIRCQAEDVMKLVDIVRRGLDEC